MKLLVFKIIAGAGLFVFVRFSGKANRKKQIAHVTGSQLEPLTVVLKLSMFVPLFLYGYALVRASELLVPRDLVALGLALAGAALIAWARAFLGEFHTGAGYSLAETELVTSGVYAWIRHPIYTAFALMGAGETLYLYTRVSTFVLALVVVIVVANCFFCAAMAGRETGVLVSMFGEEGRRYRDRVHAFLPLRRYEPPPPKR